MYIQSYMSSSNRQEKILRYCKKKKKKSALYTLLINCYSLQTFFPGRLYRSRLFFSSFFWAIIRAYFLFVNHVLTLFEISFRRIIVTIFNNNNNTLTQLETVHQTSLGIASGQRDVGRGLNADRLTGPGSYRRSDQSICD